MIENTVASGYQKKIHDEDGCVYRLAVIASPLTRTYTHKIRFIFPPFENNYFSSITFARKQVDEPETINIILVPKQSVMD